MCSGKEDIDCWLMLVINNFCGLVNEMCLRICFIITEKNPILIISLQIIVEKYPGKTG